MQQPIGSGFSPQGIACPTTAACFAVGVQSNSTGAIVYTTNGGVTWTQMSSPAPSGLNRVSCGSIQTCVAVGDAGTTVRTTDGVNWSASTSHITGQLSAVDCPSTTTCFAVSQAADIIRTTDGGASWSTQLSPVINGFWDVSCPTATTCMATSESGTMVSTINGGSKWSLRSSGTDNRLMGVNCPRANACIAVGWAGTILALPLTQPFQWWTQPANPPVVAPTRPWYPKGAAPSSASPRGSPLPDTRQANVARALTNLVQQIATGLQAILG
jgi:photosystem II stability/assembly factor-like uncharacterized protein